MAHHGWISFYLNNLLEEYPISFYLNNLLEEYPQFFGGDRKLINEWLRLLFDMESAITSGEETRQSIFHKPAIIGNNPHLHYVLRNLKLILHETEDLLDLHRYQLLEQEHQVKHGSQIKALLLRLPLFRTIEKNTKNNEKVLLGQTKKLLDCLSNAHHLILDMRFRHSPVISDNRDTDSFLESSDIIGLDKKVKHVLELLDSELFSSRNYSVIAIVGKPGFGKTTLAQLIFNHKNVKEHFERIWVYVSHKFDLTKCTQQIAEHFSRDGYRINNLDVLQQMIKDGVQGRRVLLVLDDVLYSGSASDTSIIKQMLEDEMQWEQLLAPFASCGKGSLILVTSRSDRQPLALRSSECIKLDQMEEQDLVTLFMTYAFRDDKTPQENRDMASEIAKKLKSPFEVKMIAGMLGGNMDLKLWEEALHTPGILFERSYGFQGPMMVAPYNRFVPPLKRCFSFCSIFPRGYKHEANNLVQLWVAQCFIKSTEADRSAEDIGKEYFQELLSHSIFKPFRDQEIDPVQYIMDDRFHQLAERISSEDCFRFEDADGVVQIPSYTYHLSVQWAYLREHKSRICQLHNLRTLILFGPPTDDIKGSYEILKELFSHLRDLRVLDISFYDGNIIPNNVGNLKHLRYLNLAATAVTDLPQSICKLYHLQFLKLSPLIKELPSNLRNMEGLQFV